MANDKFHCYECAGKAKAKGEECSTCDGEGNPKTVKSPAKKSK
jgi:DnaJ-class molecular chaperone